MDWEASSFSDFARDVARLGRGLELRGLEPGDRVALLAENGYGWVLADLALQAVGAVSVPLHTQLAAEQIGDQIEHSGCRLVFVSSAALYQRLSSQLPRLGIVAPQVVTIGFTADDSATLDQLLAEGREERADELGWLATSASRIRPDDLLTILYTSGTTGDPKGVMLTHRNVVANAYSKCATLPLGPADLRVCWLPLSHIFARVCDLVTALLTGCETILSRGRDQVLEECQRFRPTYMNAVPYFYERCYRLLQQSDQLGDRAGLQRLLGGRMRLCNCGGAPLADHVFDYFRESGIGLVTGYGLTEAAPVVTSNRPTAWRRGSVGQVIEGVEIRIAPDGEVLARGENVMPGYYRNPSATARAIQDGWLYTGDLGCVDAEGYLFLNGRKDDLIVLSTAKKVYPTEIENLLLASPAISQCCVFGDRQNFLVALLSVEPVALEAIAAKAGGSTQTAGWQERVLRGEVDQLLSGRARHEQLGNFLILAEPFSIADGLLTAKQSMRRKVIAQRYAAELERLYEPGR